MEVKFQDFYGQYITVHNNTASGNIRVRVRTCDDINKVHLTKENDTEIETDISLDSARAQILLNSLKAMLGEEQ